MASNGLKIGLSVAALVVTAAPVSLQVGPGAGIGSNVAWAQEEPTDPANCGLNAMQVLAGWTCTAEISTENISREIGSGMNCQDATVTTTTYRGYNPSGNEDEDRRDTSEAQSDWGSSYTKPAEGCTYPTG